MLVAIPKKTSRWLISQVPNSKSSILIEFLGVENEVFNFLGGGRGVFLSRAIILFL